jgi:hypothetical protein
MQLYADLDLHSRNTYIGFKEELNKIPAQILKVKPIFDPR